MKIISLIGSNIPAPNCNIHAYNYSENLWNLDANLFETPCKQL